MFHRSPEVIPRYGSLCVRSSWRGRAAKSVWFSFFNVGKCINFLVASCTHLNFACFPRFFTPLFSSNRFQASLVSFGYLAFCLLFLHYLAVIFLLSRPFFVVCLLSIAQLEMAY